MEEINLNIIKRTIVEEMNATILHDTFKPLYFILMLKQ
jgi:hypothetical protein